MGNSQSSKKSASVPPAGCPVAPQEKAQGGAESGCPVDPKYRNEAVYNVYSQRLNDPNNPLPKNPIQSIQGADVLDPKNNMPLEPNQLPCPGQRLPLSTERVSSNIPKGGTTGTWLYPSPQMVFNALKRKGKGDDVGEGDMDGFIAAHNAMNESTWQKVAVWELLHRDECPNPTLLRFKGKPHDLSPKALIRTWLGGPEPFDRHDWTIDRCGKEVRYIIDFYFNEEKAGTPQAFELVVRPALDSFEAALDRAKMTIYENFAEWGLPCPITGTSGSIGSASIGKEPSPSN